MLDKRTKAKEVQTRVVKLVRIIMVLKHVPFEEKSGQLLWIQNPMQTARRRPSQLFNIEKSTTTVKPFTSQQIR